MGKRKKTIYIPNQNGKKMYGLGLMPDFEQENKLRKEIEKERIKKGK